MQKAVISPLNNVTFKGGDQHSEGGDQHSELNNVTFKGGDQHSEGGDQQKKNLSPRAPVGAKNPSNNKSLLITQIWPPKNSLGEVCLSYFFLSTFGAERHALANSSHPIIHNYLF